MPNTRTYTLRVVFDRAQLEKMRASNYRICIAKEVNSKYDVVWHSQAISHDNVFQWTEEYQIWTVTEAEPYFDIPSRTSSVEVAFGQTVSFDYQGIMNRASGPMMGNSFTVMKPPKGFHVMQKIGGNFQSIKFNPTAASNGLAVFTSIPTILVFLSRNNYTGEIEDTLCTAIPVSFTGNLEQTVSYVADPHCLDSGIWIIGTTPSPSSGTFAATGPGAKALSLAVASGKLSAMTPHKYSAKNGFEPLGNGADAFKMAELINFYTHEFKPAGEEEM